MVSLIICSIKLVVHLVNVYTQVLHETSPYCGATYFLPAKNQLEALILSKKYFVEIENLTQMN